MPPPTPETLTATAQTYLTVFNTLDPSPLMPILSPDFLQTWAPSSANPPPPKTRDQFAAHLTRLRSVLRSFPVRAKHIWPNPLLRQVTVWADSETEFHDEVKDGQTMDDEWRYRGEYIFVLTMDVTGERIEQVLEFVDSKGTERLRGLMARAWKVKESSFREGEEW